MQNKKHILLVDDDKAILDILTFLLRENNFSIESAINGEIALEKVKENKPALIICDNNMPVMDGITFYKKIKSSQSTQHIPFIFSTASDFSQITAEIDITHDNYINKPFDINELLLKIEQTY